MNYSFFDFLNLCGGLGLFLFGMKMMSNPPKSGGSRMRKVLATMTRNRFMGVMSGLLITSVIIVAGNYRNGGQLRQCRIAYVVRSHSVIMGANIGTTVTMVSIVWDLSLVFPILQYRIGLAIRFFFLKR